MQLSFAATSVGSKFQIAGVAELADALDSKSSGRKVVWVRAPPPAVFQIRIGHSELSVWRSAYKSSRVHTPISTDAFVRRVIAGLRRYRRFRCG
jgi:hypothetical protein